MVSKRKAEEIVERISEQKKRKAEDQDVALTPNAWPYLPETTAQRLVKVVTEPFREHIQEIVEEMEDSVTRGSISKKFRLGKDVVTPNKEKTAIFRKELVETHGFHVEILDSNRIRVSLFDWQK